MSEEESPLRFEILMNEILISVSLFFAGMLNDTLQEHHHKPLIFLIILSLLGIQIPLEHFTANHTTLWGDIVHECVMMISRTLSLLLVSFSIELIGHSHQPLLNQIFYPSILIFFGIAILKKISHHQRAKQNNLQKIQ